MTSSHNFPAELRYSPEDEWARKDGNRIVIGITDFAQEQLGDIVFVELPAVGARIEAGQTFGVIESVKAVSDLFAPVSGEVLEVNGELADKPEIINEDCYGAGWMLAIDVADASDWDRLLDATAYGANVAAREDT